MPTTVARVAGLGTKGGGRVPGGSLVLRLCRALRPSHVFFAGPTFEESVLGAGPR